MTDHSFYEEQIGALFDGELTVAEEQALRAHIAECEQCRAFYAAMEAVCGLAARDLPEAPADLAQNVMERVRAPKEDTGQKKKEGKLLHFPARTLAVAAAAAVVVWAGARLLPVFGAGDSSASAPAQASGAMVAYSEVTEAAAQPEYDLDAAPEAEEALPEAAEDTAGLYGWAAPEAAVNSTASQSAPAEEQWRDAGAALRLTLGAEEILLDGESVTAEELRGRLEEENAAIRGVELRCDGAAEETERAVRALLEELGVPIR